MNNKTIKQLNNLNYQFYKLNSQSFDNSRNYSWKGWDQLLNEVTIFDATSGLNILDVGCGNGRFLDFAIANKWPINYYYGLDFSQELLEVARSKFSQANFEFGYIDLLNKLPDLSIKFDLVVAWGLFHHIPGSANRLKLLSWMNDQLKPSGIIAFSIWQFVNDTRLKRKILPWSTQPQVDPGQLEINDFLLSWKDSTLPRFCHYLDSGEVASLTQAAGLKTTNTYADDGQTSQLNQYYICNKL